jgi:hypothetical protein
LVMMTYGKQQAAVEAHAAGADLDYLPHALFNGRALCLKASSAAVERGEPAVLAQACPLLMRDSLQVSIWTGLKLSGSSTPAAIQGNAIVSICIMNSELDNQA